MKQAKQEPGVPDTHPKEERRMDLDKLAAMPLESLLYYVLVVEGRKQGKPADG